MEVRHVKRNINKVVHGHGLAKEVINNSMVRMDKIWMEEIPPYISNTIALEFLTLVI
jgi:hypothetical protein